MVVVELLGELTVRVEGQPVELGPPRQRLVLAALAVDASSVVSVDRLVERVWGEDPPQRARSVLGSYVSRLRSVLGSAAVVWRSGGYMLAVDRTAVDAHRFDQLCSRGRVASDDVETEALWAEALRLWRGPALTGVDGEWASAERNRLHRQRLAAEHELTNVRLRTGQGGDLVAELAARVTEHPLDERVASQYMIALCRAGRAADALQHYQQVRARLISDLGADPTPELQELHQQILHVDPALSGQATLAGEPVITAAKVWTPRQLPAPPAPFTGRKYELAALTRLLSSAEHPQAIVISALAGGGGIGKTWLALHWAHTHADRFPDGQLFVDLRGFSPDSDPLDAATAVRSFLDALGVDAAKVPNNIDSQIALYRSLVAGRRMLIILDNAATTDQVVPLLPGTPTCTVLVTSRKTLSALLQRHGAHHLPLGTLDEEDAYALLALRLGVHRVAAEPDAVAQLIASCGRYPLALAIVAGRAQARPRIPLSEFADELHESGLRALDDDDPAASVPSVLSWSVRALTSEQRTAFALLGAAPGPDIGLPAAANLTNLPLSRLRKVLRELEESSLIDRQPGDRYSLHDLVRELALEQASQCLPAGDWEAAVRRHAEFYLHTAFAGDRRLSPNRHPIVLPPPSFGIVPLVLSDEASVMAWFDAEHACLLAVQRSAFVAGWHDLVWQLAWSVNRYHYRHSNLVDDITVTDLALAAATCLGDVETVVEMRRLRGLALARHGQREFALDELRETLALAEGHVTPEELAYVHQAITVVLGWLGQDHQAYWHAQQALRIYQELGRPEWEADSLNSVGWYAAKLGEFDRAWDYCQQALVLQRRLHDQGSEAIVLDSLGYIDHCLGRHAEAVEHYRMSVELLRTVGDVYQLANTLEALGHPYRALSRLADAHTVWDEAIELYQEQHRGEEAERLRHFLRLQEVNGV